MLRYFEHSQIYFPDKQLETTGAELGRPFEDVWFQARDDVRLHGWFYPAFTNSPRAQVVLLVCHGNAGNISHRLELCQALLSTGASVLLFDYRGYGRSQGRPGEAGTYLDAEAAYAWLAQRGFKGENIIAFGESLGGGVAAELGLRRKLAGIILQSTFTSIPDIGAELFPWLPVRLLATIHYDTRSKLPRLHLPILVIHSREDELVRFRHAERNYAVANEPKMLWEIKGGHNEALEDRAIFIAGVEKFLAVARPLTSSAGEAHP